MSRAFEPYSDLPNSSNFGKVIVVWNLALSIPMLAKLGDGQNIAKPSDPDFAIKMKSRIQELSGLSRVFPMYSNSLDWVSIGYVIVVAHWDFH